MALTNHERIDKMLKLLAQGLQPFVERELKNTHQADWLTEARRSLGEALRFEGTEGKLEWEPASLLIVLWNQWNEVFRKTLGFSERSLVSELRDVRNRWAHHKPFSTDDTYRALDSAGRLLTAIAAPEAEEVERMKLELLRVKFDEQARSDRRKTAGAVIETQAETVAGLKPWREVVTPHRDVASGGYQQAEFAADLWQVQLGEGSDEYRNPVEFFRRTFLTESLKQLLAGALKRLGGRGGDPVVQLQTNFGGGKTHSMLALYHLFSGTPLAELPGLEPILQAAEVHAVPRVQRVVIVGNRVSPGNPIRKPDGTLIRTLWGELAWQLGGRTAYEQVRADDENATSPGDRLRELFNQYGPCLVLIDEWVAYARQLHDEGDLPGGNFETHFTFAQALTEAAKLARHTLLVVSLPASDAATSSHAQTDEVEVGGERGRAALNRLRNAIGRIEASWRPASAEEGFEIVRRRLFEPLVEPAQYIARDNTAKRFFDLYRTQPQEFPPECRDSDYEKRLKAAYPIHPEVFDRLYADWSTLVKFQRTRGVLRLMAAVIHSLWERGDRSPLILPATLPLDDNRVQFELTRYLSDNWVPVIDKDVDGANALPLRLDGEVPTLGKLSACRRVAHTVYLGSAPTAKAANRGLEDRRIKLGCVQPGESPAVFGDALRRLSAKATYLYSDGARYWYDTQPTVTKLADDRAEQLKAGPDRIREEIRRRLDQATRQRGDFNRVHLCPTGHGEIPDEPEARLVVLGVDSPYWKDGENPALTTAKAMLENRGNSPRLYRNALVFLAVDRARLADLDEAVRRYLAWESILAEKEELDLSPHQQRQATTQREAASGAVNARLPEAYQWLLVPTQPSPQGASEWQALRLTGQDGLAVRASRKLKNDGLLNGGYASTLLRLELDRIPLWRGEHVEIKQLSEDFARYLYLPRLQNSAILLDAIQEGLRLLTWSQDTFAYAESFDEQAQRYRGLRAGQMVNLAGAGAGLLVKPERARRQLDSDNRAATTAGGIGEIKITATGGTAGGQGGKSTGEKTNPIPPPQPRRFHGAVTLNPERAGRDAGKIAEEVLAHLVGLVGAEVTVTLDISASIPAGVPDTVIRTVTENCRTLKFTSHGFETE